MAYVDKETLKIDHRGLIGDDDGYNISNPQLVVTGLDGGYFLWQRMVPYTEWDDSAIADDNPSVNKERLPRQPDQLYPHPGHRLLPQRHQGPV